MKVLFFLAASLACASGFFLNFKASCPMGSTQSVYNSSWCLMYVQDQKTATDAEMYCNQTATSHGIYGNAGSVENAIENRALTVYLQGIVSDRNQPVWLGAEAYPWSNYGISGTSWEWYDYDTIFEYTNFAPGVDVNAKVGYGIAISPFNSAWYIRTLDTKLPFVCKFLINP